MGLFKRGKSSIWWISFTVNGRQQRESAKTTDEKLAKVLLAKRQAAAFEGEFFPKKQKKSEPNGLTLGELHEVYLALKADKSSLTDDRPRWKTVLRLLGSDTEVKAVDSLKVMSLIGALQKGQGARGRKLKPGTINRHLEILRAALRMAEAQGYQTASPFRVVRMLREDNERDRTATPEEFADLLAACDRGAVTARRGRDSYVELRLAMVVGYWSAMRLGEIVGLRWSQVDLKAGMVKLKVGETKNREGRKVPLHAEVVDALKAHARRDDGKVFGRARGELSRHFVRLKKRLKIHDLKFHDLRHTAATRYRKAGVDLLTLQRIGGWKTLEMLKRYNTIDDDDLRDAVKKITKG